MGAWTLKLLGACEWRAPDASIVTVPTRKALAMLAILARSPGRTASRGRLASILWEESDAEQGLLHVRKALWTLRSEMGKEGEAQVPLTADKHSVHLSPDVTIDVDRFQRALSAAGEDPGRLAAACALYEGDFLADFSLRRAPSFDDWANVERQYWREQAVTAFGRLLDAQLGGGATIEVSLQTALRLSTIDPFNERAHRAIMELFARQGRASAALHHFQRFRQTLVDELGVEPEEATIDLRRTIGGRRRKRAGPILEETRHAAETGAGTAIPARKIISVRRLMIACASLVGVASLIWAFVGTPEPLPPKVGRLFAIHTSLVVTGRPALSHDGTRLVFTARPAESTNVDLYMMTLSGGEPVRLTSDPAVDDNAAWSPDATSIAFTRMSPAADRPCEIFVMTVPTGTPRRVGECRNAVATQLAWSDDRTILFSDSPRRDAASRLYALDRVRGAVRPLTDPDAASLGDYWPAIGRGGKVAFIRDFADRSSDIFTVSMPGAAAKRLTTDGARIGGLAWDRAGQGLLFASERGGDMGLWWMAAKGGVPQRISEGLLEFRRLSQARDVDRMVFEALRTKSHLVSIDLRGVSRPLEGDRSDAQDRFPAVSSTGKLAFVSNRSGSEQIWVAGTIRAAPHQLTELTTTGASQLAWSPDGSTIAFISSAGAATDLYAIESGGGRLRRLTSDAAEDSSPAWSASGEYLYFVSRRSGQSAIWRIVSDGSGPAEQVSPPGPGDFRFGSAGNTIYYTYPGRPGIWKRALSPSGDRFIGDEQEVVSDFAWSDWRNWNIAGDRLFYVARDTALSTGGLRAINLKTGETQELGSAEGIDRASTFSVLANGFIIAAKAERAVLLFGIDWGE